MFSKNLSIARAYNNVLKKYLTLLSMPHGPESVDELVKQITRGDFVIPHFQRDFDWGPSMVSDLLVSLLHGYYSGTLLFWQLKDMKETWKCGILFGELKRRRDL